MPCLWGITLSPISYEVQWGVVLTRSNISYYIHMIQDYNDSSRIQIRLWTHKSHRIRDHFVLAPNQWETMLQYNIISHWLGAFTKWSLPHISPSRASYGVSFVSICEKIDYYKWHHTVIHLSRINVWWWAKPCHWCESFHTIHYSHEMVASSSPVWKRGVVPISLCFQIQIHNVDTSSILYCSNTEAASIYNVVLL